MKKNLILLVILVIVSSNLFGQMKIGQNAKTISNNSLFEVEAKNNSKLIVTKDSIRIGIGVDTPNSQAVLDLVSSNKGILIPRVALYNTDSFAPLTSHIEGMLVYNTATSDKNDPNYIEQFKVSPGFYYNSGSRWISFETTSSQSNARSNDLNMAGNNIINVNRISAGVFEILDDTANPFWGGSDIDAVTQIRRIGHKTFFLDGRTELPLFTISNSSAYDSLGDPIRDDGNIGISTLDPKQIFHIDGKNDNSNIVSSNEELNDFVVTKEGRAGIGTINPSEKLEIKGSIKIVDGTQGNGKFLISDSLGKAKWVNLPSMQSGKSDTTNDAWIDTLGNTILSNGKVGIGYSVPQNQLSVNGIIDAKTEVKVLKGSSNEGGQITLESATSTKNWTIDQFEMGSHLPKLRVFNGNDELKGFNILENGNIGIGVVNPEWKLDLRSDTNGPSQNAQFVNTNIGTNAKSQVTIGAGNGAWSKLVGYNGALGVQNNSTNNEILTIKMDGNLGINEVNPSEKLEIKGSIKIVDGTQGNGKFLTSDSLGKAKWVNLPSMQSGKSDTTNDAWIDTLGNTILSNGKVGIGYITPQSKLSVNGDIDAKSIIKVSNSVYSSFLASQTFSNTNWYAPTLFLVKSRGVENSPLDLLNGDYVGEILFRSDRNKFVGGASIKSIATEDNNAQNNGMNLVFSTTPNGSTTQNDRLVINHNGNVGIGYSAPQNVLSVNGIIDAKTEVKVLKGSSNEGGQLTLEGATSTKNWIIDQYESSAHIPKLRVFNGSNELIGFNILENGNIGIGAANPEWRLDLRSDTNGSTQNAQFVNTNIGANAKSQVAIGAGNGAWSKLVGYNGTLGVQNYSTNNEILTIKMDGKIGVNKTNPNCALDVNGGVLINGTLPFVSSTINGIANGGIVSIPLFSITNSTQIKISWSGITDNNAGTSNLSYSLDGINFINFTSIGNCGNTANGITVFGNFVMTRPSSNVIYFRTNSVATPGCQTQNLSNLTFVVQAI